MGHLKDKYDHNYFLGNSPDPETGMEYAVLGHAEFNDGKVHERLVQEFEFARTLSGTLKGKDVLEIGFGRGDFISMFLDAGVTTYTGIDFSVSAVKIASNNFNDARVKLYKIDATQLEENNSYDLIAMYDVYEHIPPFEIDAIWEKIDSILRPGGHVVISTPIFDNPNTTDHSDMIPSVSGMHCNKQTLGTLLRTSLNNGFMIIRSNERTVGVIREGDFELFDKKTRKSYTRFQSEFLSESALSDFKGKLNPELDKRLVPGAGRLAIGCVADNKPKFLSQALRLLQSLRWFGGSMAGANFFVCVVDEIDPGYAKEFERLGAFVRVVARFSHKHPHSNKLRLLELPEVEHYDTLMLLDCDTVIVQDLWPHIDGRAFQTKMADLPTLTHEVFEGLFPHFGLKTPEKKYRTNPGGTSTIWYSNAGVLVFPKETLTTFGRAWLKYNSELIENLDLLGERKTYCDQASLALAFEAVDVPYKELPIEMNFPTHLTGIETAVNMNTCDPIIIHYHDKVDESGYLLSAPYPNVQKRIEAFNERLRQERAKGSSDARHYNKEEELEESLIHQKAICILGMHRSGTSVITRAVNLLGAYLGEDEDIMGTAPDNPKGFWERDDIVIVDDRILGLMKRLWDTALPLPHDWHNSKELETLRVEVEGLIKNKFSGRSLWAWKDPRSTVLFDLWRDVIIGLGTELDCIFVVRNPLDVARSHNKRDGFPLEKGFGIWFNYNITALRALKGLKCAFVSYDKFLADWEGDLRRCAGTLDIPWPDDEAGLREKIADFISPSLRHSTSGLSELKAAGATEPVIELYSILEDILNSSVTFDDDMNKRLETLYKKFSDYASFYSHDIERLFEKNEEIRVKDHEIAKKDLLLKDLGEKIEAFQNSLSWRITGPLRKIMGIVKR